MNTITQFCVVSIWNNECKLQSCQKIPQTKQSTYSAHFQANRFSLMAQHFQELEQNMSPTVTALDPCILLHSEECAFHLPENSITTPHLVIQNAHALSF